MYNIKRFENDGDCRIERTEEAVSYDKVEHFKDGEVFVKVMYRKPDGSIRRFWVEKGLDCELDIVDAVYIMNENGKTIDRI